ncbi:alkanesulfonate monooxygenase [Paenibacillus sp. JCM 10914]|nr:alkanesulfonate monooxygenase [Paenibacillus sp. JCM 10914]
MPLYGTNWYLLSRAAEPHKRKERASYGNVLVFANHGGRKIFGDIPGGQNNRLALFSTNRPSGRPARLHRHAGSYRPCMRGRLDRSFCTHSATERLKFLVAVRPGGISVSIAARMAASFDRLSSGRLLINVVAGGDPVEMRGDGIFLSHGERYEVTDEFLEVWNKLMTGESVTFQGKHIQVEGAKLQYGPFSRQSPPLFIGASSEAGHDVAAKHIDTYLTWAETPAMVSEKIADVRERARQRGGVSKWVCAFKSSFGKHQRKHGMQPISLFHMSPRMMLMRRSRCCIVSIPWDSAV